MRKYLFLAALAFCGPAMAQDKVDCVNAMTQADMNFCAAQDYEKADTELNAIWKKARASAEAMDAEFEEPTKGAVKALLAGQRGWIAYRDGQCELYGWEAHGGSMEPMLVSGCLAELTRVRTKELTEFVDGPAN